MTLNIMQQMELKCGVSRMVVKFNANDKVGNVLTSIDSARIFDVILNDIEKLDHLPTSVEIGSIMTNVLSEYVSEKFEYTGQTLKTKEVLESPHFIKDMTASVISANQDLAFINKVVDPKEYCNRLKSIIYEWYPEEISIVNLMREASELWVKMAVEVNPQLS